MMTIALPDHCTPTERWLAAFSSAFHTCIPTNLAFVSTALGTFSIISWLFAQVPQIYKNYKLHSASGLSILFLIEWLFGDLTNLLGALLTHQATWQVVVAAYYVTVDICLVVQYVWYVHAKPWRIARFVDYSPYQEDHDGSSEPLLNGISPTSSSKPSTIPQKKDRKENKDPGRVFTLRKDRDLTEATSCSLSFSEKDTPFASKRTRVITSMQPSISPSPRALILTTLVCVALSKASPIQSTEPLLLRSTAKDHPTASTEVAGRILSWISTALYLFSRFPQVYKNWSRHSTSGLSPTLFIAAFFGNLFYSTSILTNPLAWSSYPPYGLHGWVGVEGSDRKTWVGLAAPFWLGAAGVLTMDAIIGLQFLVYGEGVEMEVLEHDSQGRSHWKRVTGWMRGWVPSPSPDQRVRVEDEVGWPHMSRTRNGNNDGRYGAT